MLPKSIFILLRVIAAQAILAVGVIGNEVSAWARFDSNDYFFSGTVVHVITNTYGTLLVVRNRNTSDIRTLCSGWTYLPIWISACGGQSGVVASWKEPEVLALVNMLQQRDESAMTSMMAL